MIAFAVPWWAVLGVACAALGLGWLAYAAAATFLGRARRAALAGLRTLALLLIAGCLLRPAVLLPPDPGAAPVVAFLLDTSRSMSLAGEDGVAGVDRARAVVERLRPRLPAAVVTEQWTFDSGVARLAAGETPRADGPRSDLAAALARLAVEYDGRQVAGVVVISDGAETGVTVDARESRGGLPVFAVGVGPGSGGRDLELLDAAAGGPSLPGAAVDLTVLAVSRGAAEPFEVRLLEEGRLVDVRRLTPAAADAPLRAVFTVTPRADAAAIYTVEIPAVDGERTAGNNSRRVLVEPAGRRRRLLMIEGVPGFEHSFLKRALLLDPALELDSVVRKGQNEEGEATYLVQAAAGRAEQLAHGLPRTRAALFTYDAVILANIAPDAFTLSQLELLADFVGERGGGLLALGASTFAAQGLERTPLDVVLPVALGDRGAGVVRAARVTSAATVTVTEAGRTHPVTRVSTDPDEVGRRWAAVPSLGAIIPLGPARPAALVLATAQAADGPRPLIVVQRYGEGRSMVFTAEASWRWRMRTAAADQGYERFWRQAARWLAEAAPDPVRVSLPQAVAVGDVVHMSVDVRRDDFTPADAAGAQVRVSGAGGTARMPLVPDPGAPGRLIGQLPTTSAGVLRLDLDGVADAGSAPPRWLLVGGTDRELSAPGVHEASLRQLAEANGGRYVDAAGVDDLVDALAARTATPPPPGRREIWDTAPMFAAIVGLLAVEWILRRRWGLR